MAGLVAVIALLAIAVTVFAVKYLKSKRGETEHVSDENPDDLNVHRQPGQIARENVGVLNVNGPTDNSSNENPVAVTDQYLTIAESHITAGNSHPLTSQYESI